MKTIKVGPHKYTVIQMHKDWHGETDSFGQCDTSAQTIKLSADMLCTRQVETVIHEILHAIYYEYSLEKCDDEEHMVSVLGQALTALFVDNPEFISYLSHNLT